jgi:hypothetical protein
MTLYLLKVHLQTFLSIPVTQKCQILSCDTLVANERCTYIYTHTYLTPYRLYFNYRCSNNTAEKHFYTNRSGAKCWLDIYRWGAGLAVTERIRDIGQKILQYSFQTGSSSSHSYCHMFSLIAFLEEAFIRNIIIILWINYIL